MSRRTRITVPLLPHLVRHRGHNGSAIFTTDVDQQTFIAALAEAAVDSGCGVLAYALLPDQVLVLCAPGSTVALAQCMQDLGRRYARYFNTTHGRTGALWDGRYRVCVVEPGGPALDVQRYVDTAASRAGLAALPAHYRWCSAAAHLGRRREALLSRGSSIAGSSLSIDAAGYRRLLAEPLPGSRIGEIEQALISGLVFGSERFKDELERRLQRPVRPGRPGRPRGTSGTVHRGAARRFKPRRAETPAATARWHQER